LLNDTLILNLGGIKAGPFAMISLPEPDSHLGPLCTDPNLSTKPVSCDP
jgi:hypothetical protein